MILSTVKVSSEMIFRLLRLLSVSYFKLKIKTERLHPCWHAGGSVMILKEVSGSKFCLNLAFLKKGKLVLSNASRVFVSFLEFPDKIGSKWPKRLYKQARKGFQPLSAM